MVERVDERKGRGAVKGPSIVEGRRDIDGGLVHIGNAEIHLPHDGGEITSMRVRFQPDDRLWPDGIPGVGRERVRPMLCPPRS